MILSRILPATGWLIICTILLVLPGSAFPKEDWLSKIWFDKWVHIGLFGILTFLWCRVRYPGINREVQRNKILYYVVIAVITYGVAMEFIQQFLVANRSFDYGDIVADALGSYAGYFLYTRLSVKK
jgi:VanZ family protein